MADTLLIQAGAVTIGVTPGRGGVHLTFMVSGVTASVSVPAQAAAQLAAALAPETVQQRDEVTA